MKNAKILQNIINRFTVQSFAIKGFSLSFLSMSMGYYGENVSCILAIALSLAVVILWCLDSYYLKMERLYRNIDEYYGENPCEERGDFDYKNHLKNRNIQNVCFCSTLFSKTIIPIYLIQFILIYTIWILQFL